MNLEMIQNDLFGKRVRNPYIVKFPWAVHALTKHVYGESIRAPVAEKLKKGGRVLDVGCGAGSLVIDIASNNPNCTVIGVDIDPDFPDETIRQPNAWFVDCKALDLPFPDNSFDYVTQRYLHHAFTMEQWPLALRELLRVCKPDGWIELVETDYGKSSLGPRFKALIEKRQIHERSVNIEAETVSKFSQLFQDTNMVSNIKVEERKAPIGNWADNAGTLMLKCIKDTWDLNSFYLDLGMNKAEWDEAFTLIVQECNKTRAYIMLTSVSVQKRFTN